MSKNFEQDRHYTDLDGNLRTFTIRDYSRNKGVAMGGKESVEEIEKSVYESTVKLVEDFMEEVPAIYARYIPNIVEVKDDKIQWVKEALIILFMNSHEWGPGRALYYNLLNTVHKSILEYMEYDGISDPHALIDKFKQMYRTKKTL